MQLLVLSILVVEDGSVLVPLLIGLDAGILSEKRKMNSVNLREYIPKDINPLFSFSRKLELKHRVVFIMFALVINYPKVSKKHRGEHFIVSFFVP